MCEIILLSLKIDEVGLSVVSLKNFKIQYKISKLVSNNNHILGFQNVRIL